MTRSISLIVVALGLTAGHGRRAQAQLTLAEALRQADRGAFPNRLATGNATAQAAQRLAPLEGILPTVRFEAGYLTTNDPIGVFGSTLRQRAISTANFDPERLNHPAAVGNYQGGCRCRTAPAQRRRLDRPARGNCRGESEPRHRRMDSPLDARRRDPRRISRPVWRLSA